MEKDEMGMDYLTESLSGKWPIWQEDQVVNGQIGKGPNARGRNGKGWNGRRNAMIPEKYHKKSQLGEFLRLILNKKSLKAIALWKFLITYWKNLN